MPDRSARLHRTGSDAVVDQMEIADDVKLRRRPFRLAASVAHFERKANVGRYRIPNTRRTCRNGAEQVDHARQRLIFDLDQLCGVASLRKRFGRRRTPPGRRHAEPLLSKEGAYRPISRWASGVFRHEKRRQTAQTATSDIVARENA